MKKVYIISIILISIFLIALFFTIQQINENNKLNEFEIQLIKDLNEV